MFENLRELTKTTQEQKIALSALMACGFVNWIEYNKDGSITVQWEDGKCGLTSNYTITKKGETKKTMSTLELLQLQNEHKDNFFGKGEDATEEQKGE